MISHQSVSALLHVPEDLGEFETSAGQLVDEGVEVLLLFMREGGREGGTEGGRRV